MAAMELFTSAIVVAFTLGPIFFIVGFWRRPNLVTSTTARVVWRLICVSIIAGYYLIGPRFLGALSQVAKLETTPLVREMPPKEEDAKRAVSGKETNVDETKSVATSKQPIGHVAHGAYVTLLVILASVFIAIAGQQATYVHRLDKLRESPGKSQKFLNEANAAYFLVASGFWSFSLAVPSTFGLIKAHLDLSLLREAEAIYGMYQWFIVTLFVGGWVLLMAGALLRFGRYQPQ